ncbi:tetratricopeptide repeat-containing response regulator [Marinobacter salexigens]|uniref:tetratricopeptide repeat-containing response regulator n=1 Tax=Marinobacter salexigens TaxID=1925763 RepID=UPI000C2909CD|nr:tetratricopeptide repeat-containing response regulator [Marinobacter salexigens]
MSIPIKKDISAFGKLTYLVIDDFENFRISMRHMLRSCGAQNIELVANARPAIQYCTYNHVDVVLCDYNLGKGKNGQHILEELRHKKLLKRTSLFLMVTSETSRQMVLGAREYQPDAYLTKPINRTMLEKRLGSLIEQRNALLTINRAIDQENYPEAISLCIAAVKRLPRYKTWLMKTLGELYFLLGDLSHALKVYDDVLSQRELTWARVGRSKILLANHRYNEAVESLNELVKAHPDHMEAYDLLALGLERQNRSMRAQKVLEQATQHSPNALLRQKHLAELAESNQDMTTAAKAWRSTVILGTYSIHDNPDHYISLSHALCELSEGDKDTVGEELANEALSILDTMLKRFPDNQALELRSQIIKCRIYSVMGQTNKANSILVSVDGRFPDTGCIPLETGLDYAKTLFQLGHESEAKKLLDDLATSLNDDAYAVKKIENLLDEPVSFRLKINARSLNREGISAFESGDLNAAEDIFTKALEIIPDHPALNLNQVQVLIKKHASGNSSEKLIERCKQHLDRLSDLPERHRQYRRYVALKRKLQALTL